MGALHGGVTINDNSLEGTNNSIEHELYLYGLRTREIISSFGLSTMLDVFSEMAKSNYQQAKDDVKRIEFFAISESGDSFRLTAVNGKNGFLFGMLL